MSSKATWVRILLAIAVVAITLEVGSCALLATGAGGGATPPPAAGDPLVLGPTLEARGEEIPKSLRPYVIHPYLGFVRNRDLARHTLNQRVIEQPVNEHGFFGPAPGPANEQEFSVALAGGSVALELFFEGGDELTRRLAELPAARGKRVRLVSLALGGFKQPQQLAALSYFFGLGHHFDLVLNLDGFNEAVLPSTENRAQKIAPDYPRMWRVYASRSIDADTAILYGRVFEVKRSIEATRRRHARVPLRHSRLAHLVGQRRLAGLVAEQHALEASLRESLSLRRITAQEEGPPYDYGAGMFDDFAALWRSASTQMWALSRANGADYVHFLQPNQYVAGSKVFTEAERRDAVAAEGTPYRTAVESGYPALLEASSQLGRDGVPFVDLTPLFADVSETLYRDRCCHLNERGNALLVEAIVDAVAAR